jgi:hypothetical protein
MVFELYYVSIRVAEPYLLLDANAWATGTDAASEAAAAWCDSMAEAAVARALERALTGVLC